MTVPFGPRLAGKVALISGVASGQGRAAMILFVQHGARVVGCDLNEEGAVETARAANAAAVEASSGGEAVAVRASVFEDGDVGQWIATAIDRFGVIDILYNNAALADFGMVEDMELDRWRQAIQWELDGVFLPCRHAFPFLRRGASDEWTSVINTASVSGMVSTYLPGMVGGMAHAAGKAGVLGLTRSLAEEYAPWAIRVNSISPGSVWTPSLELSPYANTREFLDALHGKLLIKRRAEPAEVAACALFLASGESSYITGVNIPVDGGWTAL